MIALQALDALDWFYILTAWFTLACLLAPRFGRALRDTARHRPPVADPEPFEDDYPTAPIPAIPPVPSQRFTDEQWLADQPVDVLGQNVIDMEFRAMTAGFYA